MNWADLFERAEEYETDVETIRGRLAARRQGEDGDQKGEVGDPEGGNSGDTDPEGRDDA